MINITDIPDWCLAETLGKSWSWTDISSEDYKRLFEMSPMATPVKIPTLLFLGAKDRRVPYQAGLAYHNQACSLGTEIKTYIYPESNHSLADSVNTEFDIYVKSILFLEENLWGKK